MPDILSKIFECLGEIFNASLERTLQMPDKINNEYDSVRDKADKYSDVRLKKAYQSSSSPVEKKAYYDELTERKNKEKK